MENSTSHMLAKYVNALLTKGSKVDTSNMDFDKTLENGMVQFVYVLLERSVCMCERT